jgi:glucose-6-phosphate isomerase
MSITSSLSWKNLISHYDEGIGKARLSDLIKAPNRVDEFSISMDGMYVDFSKNRVNSETLNLLVQLAEERGLSKWIENLFLGEKLNDTEDRAALHTILRARSAKDNSYANSVHSDVDKQLCKMEGIVNKIRSGQWRGSTGKAITDVVNIGVGGSDLGPLMITHALQTFKSPVNLHFISSIDGTQTSNILKEIDQETTLFVLASKSFSTIDTLSNAETALNWLKKKLKNNILNQHFIGVSTKPDKMLDWGIPEKNQLLFWDWVGGRYSMWSAIGLSIALQLGMDGFKQFLVGAREMDGHFANADFKRNIPVMLALIDVWNINFLGIEGKAILPYDARLKYLPAYLSQLVMESNGKSVDRQGNKVDYKTCPILWGEVGPNAQHAFYQLLHQGTQKVTSDFIAIALRDDFNVEGEELLDQSLMEQQYLTLSNCFAQSRVLMLGDDAIPDDLKEQFNSPFKRYEGNQPSNTILLDEISPNSLGKLIALYEHKTFVESVIWDINPFDQWGVELGKLIAQEARKALAGESLSSGLDCSTEALIKRVKR